MKRPVPPAADDAAIAGIVRRYLASREFLELEGLGTLRARPDGSLVLLPEKQPRIFIGYTNENLAQARRLSRALRAAGFLPWLDKEQLMPGQNWTAAIERAIAAADFAIQCFSSKSALRRRSFFYRELRMVLETASRTPLDEVFLIPVRIEDCEIPSLVSNQYQYVDLFPDWDAGVRQLVDGIARQHARRCDKT